MNGENKVAIFDCDGTLVDSQHMIVTSMSRAFMRYELEPPEPSAVRHVVGLSLDKAIWALLGAGATFELIEKLVPAYKDAFIELRQNGQDHEPLFDGIETAIESFLEHGWTLAVATGKSRRGLDHVLTKHALSDHFICLRTADDGPSKPDPTMILEILGETNTPKGQAVMIGDTTYDIEMARAAGVFALGVNWGYHDRGLLEEAGAHDVVDTAGELNAVSTAFICKR